MHVKGRNLSQTSTCAYIWDSDRSEASYLEIEFVAYSNDSSMYIVLICSDVMKKHRFLLEKSILLFIYLLQTSKICIWNLRISDTFFSLLFMSILQDFHIPADEEERTVFFFCQRKKKMFFSFVICNIVLPRHSFSFLIPIKNVLKQFLRRYALILNYNPVYFVLYTCTIKKIQD